MLISIATRHRHIVSHNKILTSFYCFQIVFHHGYSDLCTVQQCSVRLYQTPVECTLCLSPTDPSLHIFQFGLPYFNMDDQGYNLEEISAGPFSMALFLSYLCWQHHTKCIQKSNLSPPELPSKHLSTNWEIFLELSVQKNRRKNSSVFNSSFSSTPLTFSGSCLLSCSHVNRTDVRLNHWGQKNKI